MASAVCGPLPGPGSALAARPPLRGEGPTWRPGPASNPPRRGCRCRHRRRIGGGSFGRQYVLPSSSRTAEQSLPVTRETAASTGVRWMTATLPTVTAAIPSLVASQPASSRTGSSKGSSSDDEERAISHLCAALVNQWFPPTRFAWLGFAGRRCVRRRYAWQRFASGSVCPGSVCPGSVCPGSVCPGSVCPGLVCPGRASPLWSAAAQAGGGVA